MSVRLWVPMGLVHVLMFCALAICAPIHHLIFTIICFLSHSGSKNFPEKGNCTELHTVSKSMDKASVANCKPISLLCCISKGLEQINKYSALTLFQTVSPSVVWFSLGSIISAVPSSYSPHHYKGIFSSDQFNMVCLDFRKVFDSVHHTKLLLKLCEYWFDRLSVGLV